ncbi:YcgN family cysteine cluster protein [Croceicoccus gelatinilyticus]|uniref:YcgN family cysteine cluster protein n=1 Tax=Croceicoccus gelatinilyticus TaxID=2835536 RepID=UPI001BCA83F1|nr:YcgN family cysteine cluster protein [Croceicoccus gelatinilyticus]MBS7671476.1 YcgN family cysteine cluster protein [Croceicoccus gelatinilyticus]
MGEVTPPFWERPLDTLDGTEWEALCDGCGQCCLHKLEDADTGEIYETDVACTLLDVCTARCTDYPNRKAKVPDCLQLTRETAGTLPWLPETCAYRLRAEGKPLYDWHYLISGSRETIIEAGVSAAGRVISEDEVDAIEDHVRIEGFEAIRVEDDEE